MFEGIIVGIITASIMILINALVRRVGVSTRTDRIEDRLDKLEEGLKISLKGLLATVVALRDGKTNGECEAFLHDLNDYLIKK